MEGVCGEKETERERQRERERERERERAQTERQRETERGRGRERERKVSTFTHICKKPLESESDPRIPSSPFLPLVSRGRMGIQNCATIRVSFEERLVRRSLLIVPVNDIGQAVEESLVIQKLKIMPWLANDLYSHGLY